jgi:hypothetical protein
MSNVLDTTKSTLGKLLAAENIRIEHRQVQGPSFDVKDRVLVLPIWKDVDADLYDLMIGHEVGHALYTPVDGWVDRVKELGQNFKGILNIVEDARIEKLMKRKFPGLRKPMYNGYSQLVNRGFFGVGLDDMKNLPFADRVNVYFKLGPRAGIVFNEAEHNLVTRIENAESWDDVMSLSEELFKVAGDEFNNLSDDIFDNLDALADAIENMQEGTGDGDGEGGSGGNSSGQGAAGDPSGPSGDTGRSLQEVLDKLRDSGKNEAADKLERMAENKAFRETMTAWAENQEMESITDDALSKNQEKLIDASAYPITYTFYPELNHKNFVIPAKIVHDLMRTEFGVYVEKENELYNSFMATNRNYISYLVKEFELKRNARQFAKARVSKTGKLDTQKVWRYQLSEDLFLQSTHVPNGKNHGMLMVIDMSSSMTDNMPGTIEQIINLSMFCRKVNIPFDVYGFIDSNGEKEYALAGITRKQTTDGYYSRSVPTNDTREGSLQITNSEFRLKQLLHYKMGTAEFNSSVKNLLLLSSAFKSEGNYYNYYSRGGFKVPESMRLGGTPLNEAVLVLRSLAEEFKKNTRVEILNTILLTDGEASYGINYLKDGTVQNIRGFGLGRHVIEDRKSKKQVLVTNCGNNTTLALLEMYKQTTGSRVIGFYLMSGRSFKSQITNTLFRSVSNVNYAEFDRQYAAEFNKYKYFGMKIPGYDVYYMVPGDELEVEEMDMDTVLKGYKDTTKKGSLLKAFKKMQNTKMISRVFLNKFIEQVA